MVISTVVPCLVTTDNELRNPPASGMFTTVSMTGGAPRVIADPYGYFGWLRENDPVHWNALFKTWIVTRHGDVVWLIRNHKLFSSAIQYPKEPRDEYPIPKGDGGGVGC